MSNLHIPRKKRIQFNIALTMFEALEKPRRELTHDPILGAKEELILEDEKEIDQFFFDMKQLPVDESAIDEAFKQLSQMVKYHMRKEGLVK